MGQITQFGEDPHSYPLTFPLIYLICSNSSRGCGYVDSGVVYESLPIISSEEHSNHCRKAVVSPPQWVVEPVGIIVSSKCRRKSPGKTDEDSQEFIPLLQRMERGSGVVIPKIEQFSTVIRELSTDLGFDSHVISIKVMRGGGNYDNFVWGASNGRKASEIE
jgi:hypothetical protein